jgi:hypothetical protein
MNAIKPPDSCAVAFKEWEGVCDALGDGRQIVILRKGGIAEGPSGFIPEHDAFWLYPTRVHQAQQGLRIAGAPPTEHEDTENTVRLRALATVSSIHYVDRIEALVRLAEEHVWTEETVRSRFFYRRPGLWVLSVRVYLRPSPWSLPVSPEHAGCRTWVPLEEALPCDGLAPALRGAEFQSRRERVRAALTTETRGHES